METTTQTQIVDTTVYVSFHANACEKGMNPSFF